MTKQAFEYTEKKSTLYKQVPDDYSSSGCQKERLARVSHQHQVLQGHQSSPIHVQQWPGLRTNRTT